MKNLLIAFILLFASFSGFSQTSIRVENQSLSSNTFSTCVPIGFSFSIVKSSDSFSTSDSVRIAINYPEGCEIRLGTMSAYSISNLKSIVPGKLTFTVKGLGGKQTIPVQYTLSANCNNFSATTLSPQNTHTAIYNSNAPVSTITSIYNVTSPYFNFIANQSKLIVNNNANYLTSFYRTIKFINSGAATFNGAFEFLDTLKRIQGIPAKKMAIKMENIEVIYPLGASSILKKTNDSTLYIKAQISGLANLDSIVIREKIMLIDCNNDYAKDLSTTNFQLNYGCTNDAPLCKKVDQAGMETSTKIGNFRPVFKYRDLTNSSQTCIANTLKRTWMLVNVGTDKTLGLQLGMSRWIQSMHKIDTASIKIYRRIDGKDIELKRILSNLDFQKWANFSKPQLAALRINVSDIISPNDTLIVNYDDQMSCGDVPFNTTLINNYTGLDYYWLNHPCYGGGYDLNYYTYLPIPSGNLSQSTYSLLQSYTNLNGMMSGTPIDPTVAPRGNPTQWFDVESRNLTFKLYDHYSSQALSFKPDSSRFMVELILGPGLGLENDSMFLQSKLLTLEPYKIDYKMGDRTHRGTGDTVRAYFKFSKENFTFYSQVDNLRNAYLTSVTGDTTFFKKFDVKFKLRAYCAYAPKGKTPLTQNTYFIPDTTCKDVCPIPLGSAGDNIQINCPGCQFPAYNINQFDIQRTNLGYKDADNNMFPDQLPPVKANANEVATKNMMIGDTLNYHIVANTSTGNLTFSNIGFPFRFIQLEIRNGISSNLSFLGGVGSFKGKPFKVKANTGVFRSGSFYLDLSIDSLIRYGASLTSKDSVDLSSTVILDLKYRIKENIVGEEGNKYRGIKEQTAFLYVSNVRKNLLDDNLQNAGNYDPLPVDIEFRKKLFYWCEGGIARVVGISFLRRIEDPWGADRLYAGGAPYLLDTHAVNRTVNTICTKFVQLEGGNFVGVVDNRSDFQRTSFTNSFPNEIRNIDLVDSVLVKIPKGFEPIVFNVYQEGTTSNNFDRIAQIIGGNVNRNFPFKSLNDTTFSFKLKDYYRFRTAAYPFEYCTWCPAADVNTFLNRFSESNRHALTVYLKYKNYKTAKQSLDGNYPFTVVHSNFPTPTGNTFTESRDYPANAFNKSTSRLGIHFANSSIRPNNELNEIPFSLYSVDQSEHFSYPFIYVTSPSGKVKINGINARDVNSGVTPIQIGGVTAQSFGILTNVDGIMGNFLYRYGDRAANLNLSFTYTCSDNSTATDSIKVVYGWNCYGYPTTIKDACFLDSTYIKIIPEISGLQMSEQISVPETLQTCSRVKFNFPPMNSAGVGDVNHISISVPIEDGSLNYVENSAELVISNGTKNGVYNFKPAIKDGNLMFNLDSVPTMRKDFNYQAGTASLSFSADLGCSYNGKAIPFTVNAVTYCGNPVQFIKEAKPKFVNGVPILDSLTLSYQVAAFASCGDSTLLKIVYTNRGSKATGAYNQIIVNSANPFPLRPVSTALTSSSTQLVFSVKAGLPIGAKDSVSLYVLNKGAYNTCDNVNLTADALVVSPQVCLNQTCFIRSKSNTSYISIPIIRPTLSISQAKTDGICYGTSYPVGAKITNTSLVDIQNIKVNFYCRSTLPSGVYSKGLFIGTGTLASIAADKFADVSILPIVACDTCKGFFIEIPATNNCICAPITYTVPVQCCSISVNATPKTSSVCVGQCTTLTAAVTGVTTNTTIAWYKKGSNNVLGTNATLSVCPTIATKYKVVVSQGGNCVKSDSVQVNIQQASFLTTSAPTQICTGDNAVLSASGGASYTWHSSTGAVISTLSTVTVKPTFTSTYIVRSVSSSGCTDSKSVTVTVISQPLITTSPTDTLVCAGSNVRLKTNVVCAKTSPVTSVCNAPQTSTVTCAACNSFASGSANIDVNSGRTVCVATGATFSGSINMNGGQFVICGSATPSNINYNSGNIVVNGTATFSNLNMNNPASVFKNYGTVVFGNVTFNGSIENHGTMTVQNDFNVNSGASFTNTNRLIAQRSINNNETFINSGLVTATVDVKNNRGTMTNQCRIEAGNEFHNNALMTHNGYVSSGKATYLNGSGTTTFGIGASINARDIYMNGKAVGPSTGCAQLKVSNNSTVNSSSVAQGKIELCDANGVEINSGTWTFGASLGCGCTGLLSGKGNNGIVYSWSPATGLNNTISATPIATVTQPITYTLSVTDFAGVQSTSTIKFGIKTTGCVSARMEESELESSSSSPETTSGAYIYPNPSEHEFTLAISPKSFNTSIQVFDGKGILVEEKNMEEGESNYYFGKNYKSGIYTVKVTSGNSINYYKLVKIQ